MFKWLKKFKVIGKIIQDLLGTIALLICRWLPLSVNRAIGYGIGRITYILAPKLRRHTVANLSLCFPTMSETRKKEIAKQSLCEIVKLFCELACFWRIGKKGVRKLIKHIDGDEIRQQYEARGSVIFVSIHIGCWEIIPSCFAKPATALYRRNRKMPLQEWILKKIRCALGSILYQDKGIHGVKGVRSVRVFLKTLKAGKNIVFLIDQNPGNMGSVIAPLFGKPVPTMTLLSKLSRYGRIVFVTAKRIDDGYHVHFREPLPEIYSRDLNVSVTAMNKMIEEAILSNVEQYLWTYKRFRHSKYSHIYT